jgi:hypothetical protein
MTVSIIPAQVVDPSHPQKKKKPRMRNI